MATNADLTATFLTFILLVWIMLSREEWDKMPDLAFVLEPFIMEYIKDNRDDIRQKR